MMDYIVVPHQTENNNMDGLKEFGMRSRSLLYKYI